MWPSKVLSDSDVDQMSDESLGHRYSILADLYGEFQGAALAYVFFATLSLLFLIGSTVFGSSTQDHSYRLVIAGVLFISFLSISIYATVWYFWVRRRMRRVEKLLHG